MGNLAAAFDAFYARWIKSVIALLATRMDLEDRELYDLADRALQAA